MNHPCRVGFAGAMLFALAAFEQHGGVQAAGGPVEGNNDTYRVLAPFESGNLLLFPVVRGGKSAGGSPFITLDEGIKNGEVEVTEAGKVRGLVRPRGGPIYPNQGTRGDQVNTLVLVNNSKQPLLLLAGEIVTGGKQDRVIAKDRIVPAGGDPIDLSVFCIEPGRWTESSVTFGAAGKGPAHGFMVQPTVRQQAMVAKDQQRVWDSVRGSISQMSVAAAPPARPTQPNGIAAGEGIFSRPMNTTSYAKVMQDSSVSAKVDEAAAQGMQAREQVLTQLKQEHAVGVVVAVRGEIVWADLFADTELLSRYWTKLVRSYAAESLTAEVQHRTPTISDAQRFLDAPAGGTETSEGEVGVYRYRELKSGGTETFVLRSLLPTADYDVHTSKLKVRSEERPVKPVPLYR